LAFKEAKIQVPPLELFSSNTIFTHLFQEVDKISGSLNLDLVRQRIFSVKLLFENIRGLHKELLG
jgi:hypothetical protein